MSCSGCGGKKHIATNIPAETPSKAVTGEVVGKSENPDRKVRLRYYGGGIAAKKVAKCAACGSAKGSYSRVTNEMIMFASDDATNGMYEQMVEAGRDYWVTEKQAEYMLSLTYTNQSGQVVNKFKRID